MQGPASVRLPSPRKAIALVDRVPRREVPELVEKIRPILDDHLDVRERGLLVNAHAATLAERLPDRARCPRVLPRGDRRR